MIPIIQLRFLKILKVKKIHLQSILKKMLYLISLHVQFKEKRAKTNKKQNNKAHCSEFKEKGFLLQCNHKNSISNVINKSCFQNSRDFLPLHIKYCLLLINALNHGQQKYFIPKSTPALLSLRIKNNC